MCYNDKNYEWTEKGGTLGDKTAFKEFGLTQNDIINAINEGKLQFRSSIYGYPYLRLLRSEVEKLAEEKFGKDLFIWLDFINIFGQREAIMTLFLHT